MRERYTRKTRFSPPRSTVHRVKNDVDEFPLDLLHVTILLDLTHKA